MAFKGMDLRELPEPSSPGYLDALRENCIEAYSRLMSDSLALDACGVTGKRRSLILGDEEYKRRTKMLRAMKYLEEIEEIEAITKGLKAEVPVVEEYDMRDPKMQAAFASDAKKHFEMTVKAADMRRELLKLTASEEKEEAQALNVFFVALSAEEFKALDTAEVHEGSAEAEFAPAASDGAASARVIAAADDDEEISGGFIVNADGSIEDA